MPDKSHVGMSRCFYCGEFDRILLDTLLKDSLPRDCGVVDMEPCHKCQGYMEQGIILIGVKENEREEIRDNNPYRTEQFIVITEDGARRLLNNDPELLETVLKTRWCYCPEAVCNLLFDTKEQEP